MLRIGIYQTIDPDEVYEQHGGAEISHTIFWNLCFFEDKTVGLFGGSKEFMTPYIKKSVPMKGRVSYHIGSKLEISLFNPYTASNITFSGTVAGDKLILTQTQDSNPNEVRRYVFQYLGDPSSGSGSDFGV